MNPIIIGVDGSEPSLRAGRLAVQLAQSTKAKLILAYVQAPFPVNPEWGTPPPEWYDIVREQGEQQLLRVADQLQQPDAERVVLDGGPAEGLAQLAADRQASMVVVGNRGLGAVKRLFLGSVADRLAHVASCPVLIVR